MKIAVIGGGGREHAIIKSLVKNKDVEKIYALPGNGGIAAEAECVGISATDINAAVEFCREKAVDFVVVAPDDPLVLGAVDALEAVGIPCFGPRANAAIIEGSKAFSKDLMRKYNIPTAEYMTFDNEADAFAYIDNAPFSVVIKADGLALGKGVIIPATKEEAKQAVRDMLSGELFGKSGKKVVIEEFLSGVEVSVLAFTDGKTVVPMVSSMDHKRAFDGDQGLNTGGMGTIAPNPYYTDAVADECMEKIFKPTVAAMNAEGRTFKGCLYFGLMITKNGAKVIEYNCRFGDPETQVVLPLLKTDLLTVMKAVSEGKLSEIDVEFSKDSACCVVYASKGYPVKYEKGMPLDVSALDGEENVTVFHAGTKLVDGKYVTNGGRVLGITAVAPTLDEAIADAYKATKKVTFENGFYRNDIGAVAQKVISGK